MLMILSRSIDWYLYVINATVAIEAGAMIAARK